MEISTQVLLYIFFFLMIRPPPSSPLFPYPPLFRSQGGRGDKASIRRLGAKGRAGVEVELEFRLGAHEYRVRRGLSTAVLHQDGQVIANSLKAVTDKLERTLGMTHEEFFNTYFTGQKELAVMAALGKTERAAFL